MVGYKDRGQVLPKQRDNRLALASLVILVALVASCGGGGGGGGSSTPPQNVVPSITSLSPSSATAGAAAQALTINGTNFLSSSTVTYNSVAHTATFVNSTQLTISLSATDQAIGGVYPVVVSNPAPGGGASNSVNFTVNNLVPTITGLSPSSATAGAGAQTLTINGTNFLPSSTVTYNSAARTATFVSSTELTISLSASDQATPGAYTVIVANPPPGGGASNSFTFTVTTPAHFLVKDAGLYTQVERRGWASLYWLGELIQDWGQFDSVVGSTVSAEASLQLDAMKAMGVNTITFELRTADPATATTYVPPACDVNPVLGLQFPQPTATELANLPLFFDMVQSKGMKVWMRLVNTHMEEEPPTNSQTWLGAIFGAIGNHPALDLVLFEGSPHLVVDATGTTTCGIPAEPPLWSGPGSVPATYVQWAINFALSQGLPAQKLSAEAIVGSYFLENNPPGNGHLWSPIAVEKTILDNLKVPANQRTYALSFYEHRKCSDAQSLPCTDLDPHDWADQTLQYVTGVVGSGPRIVAPEMGDSTPVDQVNWNTQHALESLVFLLHKYAIDGGAFWRWTSFSNSEDSDPTLATPVKQRGVDFVYNPVQKEVVDMGGFHLPSVPNGLFGGPIDGDGVPVDWTASGNGTVSQYLLTQEPGEPEVPSRGPYAMRIVTGNEPNDSISGMSAQIPVTSSTLFTTTANLRFAWTGDPNPGGPPGSRPQVFINIYYFQQNGAPSTVHTEDTFAYFQEDSTVGFATFPVQYVTPSDAAFVGIQFGAARNGLPNPITLDVQNVR